MSLSSTTDSILLREKHKVKRTLNEQRRRGRFERSSHFILGSIGEKVSGTN